jgi:phosphoserine phosphatase RsbU/P
VESYTQPTVQNTTAPDAERLYKVIFRYAAQIGSEADPGKLLSLNADLARDLVGADRCSIWLIDEAKGELWTQVAHGSGEIRVPLGHGLVGACVGANEPLVINDAASDPRFFRKVDDKSGYVTKSVLVLPLHGNTGRVIGALQLLNKPGGFQDADVQLLGFAAGYSASAIEGQRLRREAEQARLVYRELEIAREVQRKLFPQSLPPVEGIEYRGFCRPAKQVGGDYYDFLPVEGGAFIFTLGDVSGKGIAAAMLMASIQTSLRGQLLQTSRSLAELMTEFNGTVYSSSLADKYSTLLCCRISPDRKQLTYVNAGHVCPMLVRGGSLQKLADGGVPTGLLPAYAYSETTIDLEPGDLIVCCSDGITEAMNQQDDFWAEEDVEKLAAKCTGTEVIETLVQGADTFADGAEQSDDMTVIAIRVN